MYPSEIIKQMITFNKAIFDNAFNAVIVILEQREKMIGIFFEHTPWFPDEGKKMVNEWVKAYKKRRSDKIETWRTDYNEFRPHSSLNNRTPGDYARTELLRLEN
jgi:transposase InsO family protein